MTWMQNFAPPSRTVSRSELIHPSSEAQAFGQPRRSPRWTWFCRCQISDLSHWRRGQGLHYLWRFLGWSQCSHSGKLWGAHRSWWTAYTGFTGFRQPKRNPQGASCHMLTGTGRPSRRNGCCWKQMWRKPTGESKSSRPRNGNTKLLGWAMNGGSTRLALMAWRVRKFIGGEWRPYSYGWLTTSSQGQIGASPLWMTSVGSYGSP